MSKLVRSTTQSAQRKRAAGTKVLVVPQPARTVRQLDEKDPWWRHIGVGVIAVIGVFLSIWTLGQIAWRLGTAPALRLPGLELDTGAAFTGGLRMLYSMPEAIFTSGMEQLGGWMLAFLIIAIPAGGLGAARGFIPGGPKMSKLGRVFTIVGAVASGLHVLGMLWWLWSPGRTALIRPLPLEAMDVASWVTDTQIAAGFDVLAMLATLTWVVLVFRLPTPRWLKALTTTPMIATASLLLIAMATSLGTAAAGTTPCARTYLEEDPGAWRLQLGHEGAHMAVVTTTQTFPDQHVLVVELRSIPEVIRVTDRQSIEAFAAALVESTENR